MPTTGENLKRLATAFTVRDMMVRADQLVCSTCESDAAVVSSSHPDFSVIPIKAGDRISSYYLRDSGDTTGVGLEDLISDGTGILDLVEILEHRQFAFVLGPRCIDGYVHYSDLNHHLVKLSFYVLLEAVERFALDSVKSQLTDDYLKLVLGKARFEQVNKIYKDSGDAGQSVLNYLNISDILKLARAAGSVQLEDDLIRVMKDKRNGAAHVSENLVAEYSDVALLAEVKRQSLRILRA